MKCSGHRRRRLHRLEPGRRAARARRRGDGRRRPLDRAAREPRRGAGGRGRAGRARHPRRRPRWPSWSREAQPEVVFHLAAQIDVRKSLEDPAFDASINVGGTANVLEAARAAGARAHRLRLHRRRDLRRGRGPAAAARRGRADRAALRLRPEQVRRRGLPGALRAALRPLRGEPAARQRLRAAPGPARRGRRDRDLLRPAAGRRAADRLRRRQPDPRLHICGRRGRRGAGGGRDRRSSGPINIGSGIETDVLELAARLGELGGGDDFEPELAPPRAGEVQRISLDAGRAERELGWRPQTELAEGLRLTLDSIYATERPGPARSTLRVASPTS